jgi:hypothetical protein
MQAKVLATSKGLMKAVIMSLVFMSSVASYAASCPRYCNPEVSKPCGASCISKDRACHKPWTTSCVGINPNHRKPVYAEPKFVSENPELKK